jgi:hypothetical protein
MYRRSIERSCTETEYIGRGLQTATTLNLLRGGGVEDNRTKTFSELRSVGRPVTRGRTYHSPQYLYKLELASVCVMLVLLMTAGLAGRLQKGPPQSISPEFS